MIIALSTLFKVNLLYIIIDYKLQFHVFNRPNDFLHWIHPSGAKTVKLSLIKTRGYSGKSVIIFDVIPVQARTYFYKYGCITWNQISSGIRSESSVTCFKLFRVISCSIKAICDFPFLFLSFDGVLSLHGFF